MSDGFDKEAEREKLREKFAKDDEKREHTQRMSELLLKGATMTNRHCDDCGDPIFRQDGREFCPTCHTVDAADVEQDETSTAEAGSGTDAGATPGADAASGAAVASEADATPEAGVAPDRDASSETRGTPETGEALDTRSAVGAEPTGDRQAAGDEGSVGGSATPQRNGPAPASESTAGENETGRPAQFDRDPAANAGDASAAGSDAVADARESLTRTLSRFARAAERTDDPRRARDHLRAAREAAETLSALDR